MGKKYYILWAINLLFSINTHAQSIEQEAEYADKICKKVKSIQPRYQKLVQEQFKQNGDSTNINEITFINIYTVYATKKAEKEKSKNINKVIPESIEDIPPIPLKKEVLYV